MAGFPIGRIKPDGLLPGGDVDGCVRAFKRSNFGDPVIPFALLKGKGGIRQRAGKHLKGGGGTPGEGEEQGQNGKKAFSHPTILP